MTDDLRVGRSLGRGEFRLDEDRALQKLEEFQLPTPHHYVLEMVKASRLLGAESISFILGIQVVEVLFDGSPLEVRELERLYSAAFASRTTKKEEALRHLAIGVTAARGLGLRDIEIRVGGRESFGVRLTDDEVETFELDQKRRETRIILRKTMGARSVLRFASRLRGNLPEEQLLKERCRFTKQKVLIDAVEVPEESPFDSSFRIKRSLEWGEETGELVITRESSCTTKILHHGVLLATEKHESPWAAYGFDALVDTPRLTTNLSQCAFVEDDAWEDLHRRVELGAMGALASLLRRMSAPQVKLMASGGLRRGVVSALGRVQDGERRAPDVVELIRAVEEMPIFESAEYLQPLTRFSDDDLRSLSSFRRSDGSIPYTERRTPFVSASGVLFLGSDELEGDREQARFVSLFGEPRYVDNLNEFVAESRAVARKRPPVIRVRVDRPELTQSQTRQISEYRLLVGRVDSEEDRGLSYLIGTVKLGGARLPLPWMPVYIEIASDDLREEDLETPPEGLVVAQREAFSLLASNLFFVRDVERLLKGVHDGEVERAFTELFGWSGFPEDLRESALWGLRQRAVRRFGHQDQAVEESRRRRREEARRRLTQERAERERARRERARWPEPFGEVQRLVTAHGGEAVRKVMSERGARELLEDRAWSAERGRVAANPHDGAAADLAAIALHRLVCGKLGAELTTREMAEEKRAFLVGLATR